jgi:hypothetical protein
MNLNTSLEAARKLIFSSPHGPDFFTSFLESCLIFQYTRLVWAYFAMNDERLTTRSHLKRWKNAIPPLSNMLSPTADSGLPLMGAGKTGSGYRNRHSKAGLGTCQH